MHIEESCCNCWDALLLTFVPVGLIFSLLAGWCPPTAAAAAAVAVAAAIGSMLMLGVSSSCPSASHLC